MKLMVQSLLVRLLPGSQSSLPQDSLEIPWNSFFENSDRQSPGLVRGSTFLLWYSSRRRQRSWCFDISSWFVVVRNRTNCTMHSGLLRVDDFSWICCVNLCQLALRCLRQFFSVWCINEELKQCLIATPCVSLMNLWFFLRPSHVRFPDSTWFPLTRCSPSFFLVWVAVRGISPRRLKRCEVMTHLRNYPARSSSRSQGSGRSKTNEGSDQGVYK